MRIRCVNPGLENPAEQEVEDSFYEVKNPSEDVADKIEDEHGILLSSF